MKIFSLALRILGYLLTAVVIGYALYTLLEVLP